MSVRPPHSHKNLVRVSAMRTGSFCKSARFLLAGLLGARNIRVILILMNFRI